MARLWQIRQSEAPDRYDMDYRKPKYDNDDEQEAYDCGYEKGYEDAMKEIKGRGPSGARTHRMDDDDDYRPIRGFRSRM